MGSCRAAAESLQKDRQKVSHVHLRWVNPLPKDLGEILMGFKHVLIPEINFGQLIQIIRAEYLVDAKGLNQVRGKPISSSDIEKTVKELIG
jgi:2-oxoglutarate ferredoxin oxidoreductase subunit alpha